MGFKKLNELADKFEKALKKSAQISYSGMTVREALRKVPGLMQTFAQIAKAHPDHPENFYLAADLHLVPIEGQEPPEGVPPKKWIPRYDREKSSVTFRVRLSRPGGEAAYEEKLSRLNRSGLALMLKYFEQPTSNPNPPPEMDREYIVAKVEEVK